MPHIVRGEPNSSAGLTAEALRADYGYVYPEGLNLHPNSDTHRKLLAKLMRRAQESATEMKKNHASWRRLDDSLRLFARPDWRSNINGNTAAQTSRSRQEREKAAADSGLPVLVMPVSYAALETLLVYMTMSFSSPPMYRFDGKGPEDVYGAILLEMVIEQQANAGGLLLNNHTQWRDSFVYGFGAAHPYWERKVGMRPVLRDTGFWSFLTGGFKKQGQVVEFEEGLVYEGCALKNIDPYLYLPDPNVPIHEPQRGEYVGWISQESYLGLRRREQDSEDFIFNMKYLKDSDLRSSIYGAERKDDDARRQKAAKQTQVDVLWMYVELVPKDWGLGSYEYPEKWLFGVAADKCIIAAKPLDLLSNEFPVTVAAPGFDGHSLVPMSRMESVSALQQLIDFLYTSHVQNIRKVLNDMFLVDPQQVNIYDLANPSPGKIIRTRRSQWGRGVGKDALQQLNVTDVTQGNVNEALVLQELVKNTTGANDLMQGNIQNRGPRISASMSNAARSSGLGHMEYIATLIDHQSMRPTARMFASYVQQFMEEDSFIEATGETLQRLQKTMPGLQVQSGRLPVSPMDMIVDYVVRSSLGTVPGSQDPQLWIQLFQMASQTPSQELQQRLDFTAVFTHIARQLGAKNIDDFIRLAPAPPQVVPDETLEQEVAAGNLVPFGDGQNGPIPTPG